MKPLSELKHPWPELNKMSPTDLIALRTFCEEEMNFWYIKQDLKNTDKWNYHFTIVQQHIDKSTAHYFGEESKS